MKKLIITLFAILAMTFSAKAQLYVGGSVGLGVVSVSGTSNSSWSLAPEVGYNFSEKIAAGASLELQGSPVSWTVNPYFRWKFAKVGKATFLSDFMASIGGAGSSLIWGLSANPGVAFELTDKVSLVTRFAAIGITGSGGSTAFQLNLFQTAQIGIFFNL